MFALISFSDAFHLVVPNCFFFNSTYMPPLPNVSTLYISPELQLGILQYSAVFSMVTSLNNELVFSRWNTVEIDGHDVEQVCRAFHEAKECKDRPTAILAKTYKGKGVPGKISLLSVKIK